jgi:hypothetical protein
MNASFDGELARLELKSSHVVLIDPLALDGLARQLAEICDGPVSDRTAKLAALGDLGLRIGLHQVPASGPGFYEVSPDSFESVDGDVTDSGVFDIESGTVVIIDVAALGAVARALTWDRYDGLLQLPVGDFSILEDINAELGGPRFAIVSAHDASPFTGDGAFRLRADMPSLAKA